jgi:AhpD family alkylhydroperoxidase
MGKDFRRLAAEVSESSGALRLGIGEAMLGFKALGRAAYADGTLSRKTKELIAFAISIAARCDGCLAYHAKPVDELGASRDEVLETIGVALQMGGGPSMVYGGEALRAFDSFHLHTIPAE